MAGRSHTDEQDGVIRFRKATPLRLDYGAAGTPEILGNLSCAALIGERLWTVADEGRTLECLKRAGAGFKFEVQYELDAIFGDLLEGDRRDEIDLEAMSFDGKRLWLCGSHCRVRRKPQENDLLEPDFRRRPSRHLFGSIAFAKTGELIDNSAIALPATGKRSLRALLGDDPYLEPFLKLPSKEGGLDIEGALVANGRAYLGLRGPLIDSVAVIVELELSDELRSGATVAHRHFVRLDGLGVRGLAKWGKDILVIAGPVADAPGPFRLTAWRPRRTERIQAAVPILDWPNSTEKPEGICRLTQPDGAAGLLVLFDNPEGARLKERVYTADFLPAAP